MSEHHFKRKQKDLTKFLSFLKGATTFSAMAISKMTFCKTQCYDLIQFCCCYFTFCSAESRSSKCCVGILKTMLSADEHHSEECHSFECSEGILSSSMSASLLSMALLSNILQSVILLNVVKTF